ncbi:MAG: ribonuclease R [Bdellovibrio sp. CG10_big_fil_rev_8_21_14_0_10_47_8]|nr:MAG: ribonuclease R [Bdellovibrio sp. CG10_big_fil_rev_8_21_14_0_10_47_8]
MLLMSKKFLQGMIKRHPDGFGFFIPDQAEHPDVYIPRHSMKGAMTNDQVMIQVFPERDGQRFRGDIIRIVERGAHSIVGTFSVLNAKSGIIRDEGKGWGEDLRIDMKDSMNAKNGELVSAKILTYPEEGGVFTGQVTEVIGHAMDPLTDIKRVLLQNQIPHDFPIEVEKESQNFKEQVSEADKKGRKDLRSKSFITIDGATAKDFDDAIYIETDQQGFKLYVAIADVSHYVRPGSAIDREAYERGTSVYFPNFVVPMLPEVLSNGLCSLNPHIPRLALVAEIHLDFIGEPIEAHFYEAVIESKSRVTYGEAQEVIDGNVVEKHQHVADNILLAADLAKILMAKRTKDGSLDLEIPETEVVIDSAGIPIDFIRSERLFAHRLIEEMMLAANVAVAKFLSDQDIAALYRIHEPPNEDAIAMLERYLASFGSNVNIQQGQLQKRLTKALQSFEGKPEAQILNILTLRSMSQAKYSPNNVGHFGLGFEFYTHFTSPIRRYPDLIVHRLLKNRVMPQSAYRLMTDDDLSTSATMLSACEQRSTKAERQFQSIKKARFMQKHIGEEFDGLISSVTKFGVFVLLRQFEVDGLVRSENLSKEKLEFDEQTMTLVGKRSGIQFSIGDIVRIRVDAADPEAGQVDFGFVERLSLANGTAAPAKPAAKNSESSPQKYPSRRNQKSRSATAPSGPSKSREQNRRGRSSDKQGALLGGKKSRASAESLERIARHQPPVAEKNSSSQPTKSGKFDPESHFDQAMDKWKKRNGDMSKPIPRRRFEDKDESERPKRRASDRSEEKPESSERPQKTKSGQSFFKKFRKSKKSTGGQKGRTPRR